MTDFHCALSETAKSNSGSSNRWSFPLAGWFLATIIFFCMPPGTRAQSDGGDHFFGLPVRDGQKIERGETADLFPDGALSLRGGMAFDEVLALRRKDPVAIREREVDAPKWMKEDFAGTGLFDELEINFKDGACDSIHWQCSVLQSQGRVLRLYALLEGAFGEPTVGRRDLWRGFGEVEARENTLALRWDVPPGYVLLRIRPGNETCELDLHLWIVHRAFEPSWMKNDVEIPLPRPVRPFFEEFVSAKLRLPEGDGAPSALEMREGHRAQLAQLGDVGEDLIVDYIMSGNKAVVARKRDLVARIADALDTHYSDVKAGDKYALLVRIAHGKETGMGSLSVRRGAAYLLCRETDTEAFPFQIECALAEDEDAYEIRDAVTSSLACECRGERMDFVLGLLDPNRTDKFAKEFRQETFRIALDVLEYLRTREQYQELKLKSEKLDSNVRAKVIAPALKRMEKAGLHLSPKE